jgi:iduronate 2-sulfatase
MGDRKMKNRNPFFCLPSFCRTVFIALLLLAPMAGVHADASSKKPNVLFIVVDDLKPLLGCYGTSWIKSPNIDRLASRGTLFTSSYCQVSFCAPSRMSVLTGLRPDSTRVFFNPTQPQDILRTRFPDLVTLPQQFRNHGYITHPLHKVFDGRTVDAGHDLASWSVRYGPWEMAPGEKPAPGGYQDPATKARLAESAAQGKSAAGPATEACDIADNAYHDGGVAFTAAKRIREFEEQGQPFFLAVGFVKPHLPFIAPKKYWDLYDRASLPLAPVQNLPKASPHDLAFYSHSGELRAYSDVPKTGPISESQQRELIYGYAACVSYIDAQVGLLMKTLEETGIADNTIICLWGDHGFHLGEHGHWGKVTNYEDATRAPLIIATPHQKQSLRVTKIVEFLDIYPTLCELANLPVPQHVEGKSLVPLMRGETHTLHEAAISQMAPRSAKDGIMGWALRTPRYRYIEWRRADLSTETPRITAQIEYVELYDYQTDPLERKNLADKQDHLAALNEQQDLFDKLLPHLPKATR